MQNEYDYENSFVRTPRVIRPIHRSKPVDFCDIISILLLGCLLVFIFLFLILLYIYVKTSNSNILPCIFNSIFCFLLTLFTLLNLFKQ